MSTSLRYVRHASTAFALEVSAGVLSSIADKSGVLSSTLSSSLQHGAGWLATSSAEHAAVASDLWRAQLVLRPNTHSK